MLRSLSSWELIHNRYNWTGDDTSTDRYFIQQNNLSKLLSRIFLREKATTAKISVKWRLVKDGEGWNKKQPVVLLCIFFILCNQSKMFTMLGVVLRNVVARKRKMCRYFEFDWNINPKPTVRKKQVSNEN